MGRTCSNVKNVQGDDQEATPCDQLAIAHSATLQSRSSSQQREADRKLMSPRRKRYHPKNKVCMQHVFSWRTFKELQLQSLGTCLTGHWSNSGLPLSPEIRVALTHSLWETLSFDKLSPSFEIEVCGGQCKQNVHVLSLLAMTTPAVNYTAKMDVTARTAHVGVETLVHR